MALVAGTRLGSFEVIERVGAGGMGEVYRAHDTRLQRDVAIKVLQLDEAVDGDVRRRLLREARAAAGLNHPSICTIHEVGEADGRTYIAMEYVDGRQLRSLIAEGSLSMADVMRIGRQLADGLAHAHQRGIVHADLKPANIMVGRDGQAKLLDFGLSRRLAPDAPTMTQPSFAQGGVVAGTLGYMAPERLRGAPADARSDVWALGTILQEMSFGRPDGGTTLRAVIARCLEPDPSLRYANGSEVLAGLELIERSRGSSRRPARIAVAAAMLALVAALAFFRFRLHPSAGQHIDSIAVLPFTNANGDAAHAYVAATIADQVGADLGTIRALKVIAGLATQSYEKTTKATPQIGGELGVAAVLQGSTVVVGGRMHITVRFVEATSQRQLWASTYEDDLGNLLRVSKDIARTVVAHVQATVTGDERQRMDRVAEPVDPAVLDLLHAGRPFDTTNQQDTERRRQYLERAIALAPKYAESYAVLAESYMLTLSQGRLRNVADIQAALRRAAATALRLDPESGTAHGMVGTVALLDWDWDGALAHNRRALELSPNSASLHNGMRYYLIMVGRYDEAIAELARFRALYPTFRAYPDVLVSTYLFARRYDRAVQEFAREPPAGRRWNAAAEILQGHARNALESCDALASAAPALTRSVCGFVYGRAGHQERAEAILDDLSKRSRDGEYVDPFHFATVEAGLERGDQVFRYLQEAADGHSPHIVELTASPWLDAWHNDPRYQALVQRIGFPQFRH